LSSFRGVRTAHGRGLHLLQRHLRRVGNLGDDAADLLDVAEHAHALCGEQLLGDGGGGHAAERLARAGAAAAAVVAKAVLGGEGVIRVARPVLVLDVTVVAAALVGVLEQNADGRAIRLALEDTRPDLRQIRLVALRDDLRLPGAAAAQVGEEVVHAERQAGRAAVDDGEVARSVADAGGGGAAQSAEGVAWHDRSSSAAAMSSMRETRSGSRARCQRPLSMLQDYKDLMGRRARAALPGLFVSARETPRMRFLCASVIGLTLLSGLV